MDSLEKLTVLRHSKDVIMEGILKPMMKELSKLREGEDMDDEQIDLAQKIDALMDAVAAINIIIQNLS